MFNPNKTKQHGYVRLDPVAFAILVEEILIPLGFVENSNDVFKQCLNSQHSYSGIMTQKVQYILEIGVNAYFIALNNYLSAVENGVLDPKLPNYDEMLDGYMRYVTAYPSILKINKLYPRDQKTIEAFNTFRLINNDRTIKFSESEYKSRLKYANNSLMINSDANIFVPASMNLQNTFEKVSQGSLLLEGKWRSGIIPQTPITYFTNEIFKFTMEYVKFNFRLPNHPNELAILIFGSFNS